MPRPLTLHVSALNDVEYDLYTAGLSEIYVSDDPGNDHDGDDADAFWENLSVGIREVRVWLRGRYGYLDFADIDAILKLFHPSLGPSNTLTGGQFFAALRLVIHLEAGKGVDRSLAFVQAFPTNQPSKHPKRMSRSLSHPAPPTHPATASPTRPQSPSKRQPLPPPPPRHPPPDTTTNPFSQPRQELPQQTQQPHHSTHNPFLTRAKSLTSKQDNNAVLEKSTPPLPPRKQPPPQIPPRHQNPSASSSLTVHPIINNNKPTPLPPPPVPPTSSSSIKTTHVITPLMRQSLQASKLAQGMKKAEELLEKERVMQVLKSSSQRTAVWMGGGGSGEHEGGNSSARAAMPSNVNQGIGSSSNQAPNHNSSGSEHSSATPPVLPRRKPPFPHQQQQQHQPQPSSPTSESSARSLAQVANAGFNFPKTTYGSPFRSQPVLSSSKSSPTRPTTDLPSSSPYEAPPMHPDRRLSAGWHEVEVDGGGSGGSENLGMRMRGGGSPGTRMKMGRSKSMHQHPSPPPPVPESHSASSLSTTTQQQQHRRRPESVQLTPTRSPGSASATMSYNSIFDDPPFPMRRSNSPASHHGSLSGLSSNSINNTNKQGSGSIFDDPPRPLPKTPSKTPSRSKSPNSILSLPPTSPSTSSKHEPSIQSPIGHIQRTFTQLQNKAGPKLDKARFKAEAGISKRGYVRGMGGKGDGEGLIGAGGDGYGEEGGYGDEGGYAYGEEKDSGVYSASEESDDDDRGLGRGRRGGTEDVNGHHRWKTEEMLREKDSLKWPVAEGEGWKPL